MGWGTDFKADIYLNKISISEIDSKIEELEKENINYEKRILMFVSSTPKDIIPDEWKEEPIRWFHDQIDEMLTEYKQNLKILTDLYHFKNDRCNDRRFVEENNQE